MTTDNCRKEERSKANAEESEESSVPLLNSAMAVKAEKENSILPSSHDVYIVTIEGIVDECNIQEALKAVKRNKGADRKSTPSELQSQSNLVCRLLLDK